MQEHGVIQGAAMIGPFEIESGPVAQNRSRNGQFQLVSLRGIVDIGNRGPTFWAEGHQFAWDFVDDKIIAVPTRGSVLMRRSIQSVPSAGVMAAAVST